MMKAIIKKAIFGVKTGTAYVIGWLLGCVIFSALFATVYFLLRHFNVI